MDRDEASEIKDRDQEPAVFELELQNEECCFLHLGSGSSHHAMFKRNSDMDDENDRKEVTMLSADQLTVAASETLKASHNHSISDLVFYLDLVDNLNHHDNQDLSIHSKIHTFHHLLYSSKEVVYAPDGLWFLCASWTETLSTKSMDEDTPCSNSTNSTTANSTDPINSSTNQQRKSTCSQNLYFNTNFLIESRQIEDMNELQELPHSALSNLDHSGMLQLQYMHLQ